MEYQILWAYGLDDLVDKVNVFILEGWLPQGGVACMVGPEYVGGRKRRHYWCQAIIKKSRACANANEN